MVQVSPAMTPLLSSTRSVEAGWPGNCSAPAVVSSWRLPRTKIRLLV